MARHTYTTCDMCGCKIGSYLYLLDIRSCPPDMKDYAANAFRCDLCDSCAKSVMDFIKEERKVNERLDQELE